MKDYDELVRKAIIWCLQQTDSLSKPVIILLNSKDKQPNTELADKIYDAAHNIVSENDKIGSLRVVKSVVWRRVSK